MHISLILMFLLTCTSQQLGCLWVNGVTLDGEHHSVSGEAIAEHLRIAMELDAHEAYILFQNRFARDENDEISEELGAVLDILHGEFEVGIQKLLQLELDNPGLYSVAANLGTAYELIGDDAKALEWISEGMRRNPDSHHGTEWLHQRILGIKIQLAEDSELLTHKRVLDLPAEFDMETGILVGDASYSVEKLREALHYQLSERVIFVKPKDLIVADLLFAFARVEAHTSVLEEAVSLLDLAEEYGFADVELLNETRSLYAQTIASVRLWDEIYWYSRVSMGAMLFLLFLFVSYKRKWLVLRRP